jgi:hypothetical protein
MIAQATGSGMGVGRFSRCLRGVGVITMPDAGLDKTLRIEVPPGAGVLTLYTPRVAVGVYIDHRCVVDGVEFKRRLISAMRELFREDEGVEF